MRVCFAGRVCLVLYNAEQVVRKPRGLCRQQVERAVAPSRTLQHQRVAATAAG
jgi:hypothetical protein